VSFVESSCLRDKEAWAHRSPGEPGDVLVAFLEGRRGLEQHVDSAQEKLAVARTRRGSQHRRSIANAAVRFERIVVVSATLEDEVRDEIRPRHNARIGTPPLLAEPTVIVTPGSAAPDSSTTRPEMRAAENCALENA